MHALLLLALLAAPPQGSSDGSAGLSAKAVEVRGAAKVAARIVAGGVLFSIQSPGGIGSVTLQRTGATWPAVVQMQIDIRELEGVTAKTAAFSIQSGRKHAEIGEVRNLATRKTTLSKEPVNRFKISRVSLGEKPHILIQLPPVLLQSDAKRIHVQWVDFYR